MQRHQRLAGRLWLAQMGLGQGGRKPARAPRAAKK